MGAFFLFKSKKSIDIGAVQSIFIKKGFTKPNQFTFNNMTLWLYKKQLVDIDNYVIKNNGLSLFMTGTLIYKKQSYRESLLTLLRDFEKGCLNFHELIGMFCVFFIQNDKISILRDQSCLFHVFFNKAQTVFSSSFLATIAAHDKLSLNKKACLEQIINGYIVGTDTSVKDIYTVNTSNDETINNSNIEFIVWPKTNSKPITYNNFQSCVRSQLAVLNDYYISLSALSSEFGVDIGLSGGYDSRLNILLANNLPGEKTAHTHFSEEHLDEIKIAQLLSNEMKLNLIKASICAPHKMMENKLIENLNDSLYFYDGRTNKSMGTYNDVHTRHYRISVLGDNKLGLNGLGGELYRNYDYTYSGRINFIEWIKYHIMDPYSVSALRHSNDFANFLDYVRNKYINILNITNSDYIDMYTVRHFYANIFLPYAAAVKGHAENQLAFFLMPFSEYHICNEALKATSYIGMSGKLEASMITELNKEIAHIPSSYGFSFDKEPLSHIVKSTIRCYMPDRIKNTYWQWKIKYNRQMNKHYDYSFFSKYSIYAHIMDVLHETNLPVNWNNLFINKTNFERTIYFGHFLYKFSNKINLS